MSHCWSVTKSCLTLCIPMNCSTAGFPVLHHLLKLARIELMSIESVKLSNHLGLFSSHLQSFPASGPFQMSQFFASGDQSIGASASASILPMNIQDWFPLELAGLISLQSKGLSRVFKSINSLVLSLHYGPTLTSIHDYWKNHSFDYTDL